MASRAAGGGGRWQAEQPAAAVAAPGGGGGTGWFYVTLMGCEPGSVFHELQPSNKEPGRPAD
jgi:hypothetical protein